MDQIAPPRLVDTHRALLAFLALLALVVGLNLLWRGPLWIVDLLSALVAVSAAGLAFTRLIHGLSAAPARQAWRAVLLALVVTALVQLTEVFIAPAEIGAGAYWALLAATLVLLLLIARFDRMPLEVQGVAWFGLAAQAGAFAVMRSDPASSYPGAADGLTLAALGLYLLGSARAVAYARKARFAGRATPAEVGDFARYLFATSRLFKKIRHPRIGNFTVPGHRLVFMAARFVSWYPRIAPRVRRKHGVGIWRQFCDLVVVGIRHGLDAQVYYMFELYRPEHRARASGYLTRYETKNGLFKVLTWQVSKTKRRIMLGDKLGMARICEENGIPTVPLLAVAEGGKIEFRCDPQRDLQRDLFIKPRQSKGSKGTEMVRYDAGKHVIESGAALDQAGFAAYLERRSREEPILLQPRIVNHPAIADMADVALMRIRAVTCLDQAGRPVLTHAVISNLCKLETNWPTDIEFGAAIDLATGTLGPVTGDKAEMWLDWTDAHPQTGVPVRGRQLPCWEQVREIALAAHAACNDRLLVGWDIAIGPEGALLLEGNSYPDVDFLQRSHQCAIGDSVLGPMLYERLAEIERRAASGTLRGPMDYD